MPRKKFTDLVFERVKQIPGGKVSTYKLIAEAIGCPKSARAVGNALNNNHNPEIPCHRVIRSDGFIGGYNKGLRAKRKILEDEGVRIVGNKINLNEFAYKFLMRFLC